jgi:hypothetical protein
MPDQASRGANGTPAKKPRMTSDAPGAAPDMGAITRKAPQPSRGEVPCLSPLEERVAALLAQAVVLEISRARRQA